MWEGGLGEEDLGEGCLEWKGVRKEEGRSVGREVWGREVWRAEGLEVGTREGCLV